MLQPWETDFGKPDRIASALDIMISAPLGAAAFNNEFGRPNTCGYFRTFEQAGLESGRRVIRGYHKPIMIAGGLGRPADRARRPVEVDRPGRRRGLLRRQRTEFFRSGFRLRAARQR